MNYIREAEIQSSRRKPNSLQFALHPSSSQSTIAIWIWYAPLGTCINTVGDTILMWVKPWFSAEAGKGFRKRENGGVFYYTIFGESQ